MAPACPEDEFIELWRTHKSGSKVAAVLNISERAVHTRRRNVERKRGIKLEAQDIRAALHTHRQTAHHHPQRKDLGILNGTIVCFSDAHFWPGIRTTAYLGLLKVIEGLQPQAVVNNGDAFDGASISRFPRIGWDSTPSVIEELKACEIALGEIEEAAKLARHNARLVWCLGNHDARFENRLASNAPQYEHVKGFSLKDHFPAWEPCWAVWNGANTVIKHRFKGGVHATHNNTVNSGVNIVTGHLHSLKVTPFDDYHGTRYGVDTGTLADPLGPQFHNYLEESPTNWRSGFVVLTFVDGHLLFPEVVKVFAPGKIEFRGHVIDV
jgi:DNA-binding CsgD family transcriptional regulator